MDAKRPVFSNEAESDDALYGYGRFDTILLEGPKNVGTYDPREVLAEYEEGLTREEYKLLEGFLAWVVENGLTYGHGNFATVWARYAASLRVPRRPSLER